MAKKRPVKRSAIQIKNFETYQHYKLRNPPWVKLHLTLLDDPDFLRLPDASKWHYLGLILLASRHANYIQFDVEYIKNRLGLTEKLDLTQRFLMDHVLACSANTTLASSASVLQSSTSKCALSETETETETETECASALSEFEQFWKAYPKKIGKKAALKAWKNAKDRPALTEILAAIEQAKQSEQWTKDRGNFIPYPATWLNQGRWADSPVVEVAKAKPLLVVPKAYRPAPVIDASKAEPCPAELVDLMRSLGVKA